MRINRQLGQAVSSSIAILRISRTAELVTSQRHHRWIPPGNCTTPPFPTTLIQGLAGGGWWGPLVAITPRRSTSSLKVLDALGCLLASCCCILQVPSSGAAPVQMMMWANTTFCLPWALEAAYQSSHLLSDPCWSPGLSTQVARLAQYFIRSCHSLTKTGSSIAKVGSLPASIDTTCVCRQGDGGESEREEQKKEFQGSALCFAEVRRPKGAHLGSTNLPCFWLAFPGNAANERHAYARELLFGTL